MDGIEMISTLLYGPLFMRQYDEGIIDVSEPTLELQSCCFFSNRLEDFQVDVSYK